MPVPERSLHRMRRVFVPHVIAAVVIAPPRARPAVRGQRTVSAAVVIATVTVGAVPMLSSDQGWCDLFPNWPGCL